MTKSEGRPAQAAPDQHNSHTKGSAAVDGRPAIYAYGRLSSAERGENELAPGWRLTRGVWSLVRPDQAVLTRGRRLA